MTLTAETLALKYDPTEVVSGSRVAATELKKVGKEVDSVGRSAKNADGPIKNLNREVVNNSRAGRDAAKANDQLNRVLDKQKQALMGVAAGYLGVRNAIKSIVAAKDAWADYEYQIDIVGAVSRALPDQMDLLSKAARKMGETTKYSATDAGLAMEELARRGFSVQEIIGALPHVLNLAASSNVSLGQAADFASGNMKAFNRTVSDLPFIIDLLAGVSQRTATNVEAFSESTKEVAALATVMGQRITSSAAVIGILSDNMITGTKAGTGYKAILGQLAAQKSALAKAAREAGVSIGEFNPEARDIIDIMDDLNALGLDAKQIFQIFGRIGAVSFAVLASKTDELRALRDELETVGGASEDMAKRMMDNLRGSEAILRSVTESFMIEVGQKLSPSLQIVHSLIVEWLNDNKALGREVAGTLGPALIQLVRTIFQIVDAIVFLSPVIKALLLLKVAEWANAAAIGFKNAAANAIIFGNASNAAAAGNSVFLASMTPGAVILGTVAAGVLALNSAINKLRYDMSEAMDSIVEDGLRVMEIGEVVDTALSGADPRIVTSLMDEFKTEIDETSNRAKALKEEIDRLNGSYASLVQHEKFAEAASVAHNVGAKEIEWTSLTLEIKKYTHGLARLEDGLKDVQNREKELEDQRRKEKEAQAKIDEVNRLVLESDRLSSAIDGYRKSLKSTVGILSSVTKGSIDFHSALAATGGDVKSLIEHMEAMQRIGKVDDSVIKSLFDLQKSANEASAKLKLLSDVSEVKVELGWAADLRRLITDTNVPLERLTIYLKDIKAAGLEPGSDAAMYFIEIKERLHEVRVELEEYYQSVLEMKDARIQLIVETIGIGPENEAAISETVEGLSQLIESETERISAEISFDEIVVGLADGFRSEGVQMVEYFEETVDGLRKKWKFLQDDVGQLGDALSSTIDTFLRTGEIRIEQFFEFFAQQASDAVKSWLNQMKIAQSRQSSMGGGQAGAGGSGGGAAAMGMMGSAGVIIGAFYSLYKLVSARIEKEKQQKFSVPISVQYGRVGYSGRAIPFGEAVSSDDARRVEKRLRDLIDQIRISVGGFLDALPEISVSVQKSGEKFRAFIKDQLVGVFDNIDDAMEAAVLAGIAQAEFSNIGPNVQQALRSAVGEIDIADVLSTLDLARAIDELNLSQQESAIRSTFFEFAKAMETARQSGLSLIGVVKLRNKQLEEMIKITEDGLGRFIPGFNDATSELLDLVKAANDWELALQSEIDARQREADLLRQLEDDSRRRSGSGGAGGRPAGSPVGSPATGGILATMSGIEEGTKILGVHVGKLNIGIEKTGDSTGRLTGELSGLTIETRKGLHGITEGVNEVIGELSKVPNAIDPKLISDALRGGTADLALRIMSILDRINGVQVDNAERQRYEAMLLALELGNLYKIMLDLQSATAGMGIVSDAFMKQIEDALQTLQTDPSSLTDSGGRGRGRRRERMEEFRLLAEREILAWNGLSEAGLQLIDSFNQIRQATVGLRLSEEELYRYRLAASENLMAGMVSGYDERFLQTQESDLETRLRHLDEERASALEQAYLFAQHQADLLGVNAEEIFLRIAESINRAIDAEIELENAVDQIDLLSIEEISNMIEGIRSEIPDNLNLSDAFSNIRNQINMVTDAVNANIEVEEERARMLIEIGEIESARLDAASRELLSRWDGMGIGIEGLSEAMIEWQRTQELAKLEMALNEESFIDMMQTMGISIDGVRDKINEFYDAQLERDTDPRRRVPIVSRRGRVSPQPERQDDLVKEREAALRAAIEFIGEASEPIGRIAKSIFDLQQKADDVIERLKATGVGAEKIAEVEEALALRRAQILISAMEPVEERLAELKFGAITQPRIAIRTLEEKFLTAIASVQAGDYDQVTSAIELSRQLERAVSRDFDISFGYGRSVMSRITEAIETIRIPQDTDISLGQQQVSLIEDSNSYFQTIANTGNDNLHELKEVVRLNGQISSMIQRAVVELRTLLERNHRTMMDVASAAGNTASTNSRIHDEVHRIRLNLQ